ncbi:DUF3800 domain-containing protein [Sphingobium lignivorans]|uniref:DUF3800 domain-containing protein n=1 Tax=Sphingobium lignivorans TaxID=2735886 RepID=A0ABR6NJT3_9SPHN|nr:DUF3800 domain-containing protein [Sphingobium lignivorans]MBB5987366.1 hypothetical protein [Sphingobium lignivorans]
MALYHAYIDESGVHEGSPVVAVGGYLIRKSEVRKMERGWERVLRKYGLPHFHMVDCAHGNPPFDQLSRDRRVEAESAFIELIKAHTTLGLVAIADPRRFAGRTDISDPYSFCLSACSMGLAAWLSDKRPSSIAFFFEAGHRNGAIAEREIIRWAHNEADKEYYSSHAFVKKGEVHLLEAADLLVWQAAKFMKDKISKARAPRYDFLSLMEHNHAFAYLVIEGTRIALSIDNNPHLDDPLRDGYLMAVFSETSDQEAVVRDYHRFFVAKLAGD